MPRLKHLVTLARPTGVVFFAAVGQALGGILALSFAYAHADALRTAGLPFAAILLLGGALACGLALLPTHVLSLLAGWSLGLPLGFSVALLGATLGSPVGYRLGTLLAGPNAAEFANQYPKTRALFLAIRSASPAKAALLVGLLRLSPIVPYGSTNVLAAVTRVPLIPFVLSTFIGQAPRIFAVVALGAGLEALDSDQPTSPWLIALGLAATALAVILIGLFAKQALRRAARSL